MVLLLAGLSYCKADLKTAGRSVRTFQLSQRHVHCAAAAAAAAATAMTVAQPAKQPTSTQGSAASYPTSG